MIGQTVGSYEIKAKLGEGGMGIVYAAEHSIMGRKAVVKVLRPQLSTNKEIVKRFFNEARAAASIRHPGIVDVYDVGYRDDGSAYIVMDFLEGETLAQRLERKQTLGVDAALSLIRQVLGALAAAHAQGIVHRDLKPDNIFIVRDPEVATGERAKILDFGIAKLVDDGAGHAAMTQTGAVMGTPVYMSPEQCRGAGQVDHRTDLYAVGCIVFELLCGRPPFVASAPGELMVAHMRDEPPLLRELKPSMSTELQEIIARLLAKQPEQRFASAEALIAALDEATHGKHATGAALGTPVAATRDAAVGFAATALSAPGVVGSAVGNPGEVRSAAAPSVPDTTLGGAAAQLAPPVGTESARSGSGVRMAIVGGAVVAVAALALFGWQLAGRSASPAPASPQATPARPVATAEDPAPDAARVEPSQPPSVAPSVAPDCAEPRLVLDPIETEFGANLRRTPQTKESGNIVAAVPNCTRVCELQRDGNWARVSLADGTEGFMHHTRVAPMDSVRCREDTLPPLDLAPVSGDAASLARKRNKQALERHRARDWDTAIAMYEAAQYADPGHVISRYNMACALNMAGHTERAVAVLRQLRDAGCPVCLGRLVRAREDQEWASAWQHPGFIELTRGVEVRQPPLRELVEQVASGLAAGDLAAVEGFFHPRNAVAVEGMGRTRSLHGFHAVQRALSEDGRPVRFGAVERCRKGCCELAPDPAGTGGRLRLERVCTKTDSGGVRVVSRLRFSGERMRR